MHHPLGGGVKPEAAPLLPTGPAHPTSAIYSLCTSSSTHSWLAVTKATEINSLPLPPAASWNPTFISKSSYLIPDLPPSLFLPTCKGAGCPPLHLFPSPHSQAITVFMTDLGLGCGSGEEHLLSICKGPGLHPQHSKKEKIFPGFQSKVFLQ